MTDTQTVRRDIVAEVVRELQASYPTLRDIVSYAHPGSVCVLLDDQHTAHFGIANPEWGGDILSDTGSASDLPLDDHIPSTSTDVQRIAATIHHAIVADAQRFLEARSI